MSSLWRAFTRDLADLAPPATPSEGGTADRSRPPVHEDDLAGLPEPAQRYLRFMGVAGRPRHRSFVVRFQGRFRRAPDQAWMPCDAWQYNSADDVTRIFTMRLVMAHVLPMVGHDTYVRGRGRMLGRLFGLITVADGSGPEFDLGELVTYLNDAVLLAPSMLLDPAVSWGTVDDESFDVTLTDAGRTVTARVEIDERGAPTDFSTTDRYVDLPGGLVRCRWSTPIERWHEVDGHPFPGPASARWHLEDGPFTYIEGRFVPETLAFDEAAQSVRTNSSRSGSRVHRQ